MPIRGVIFDLDGTLVDSGLDFDLMRREMGIAPGRPLLEALAAIPPEHAARCWAILDAHERRGAERAQMYPGVPGFLQQLRARGLMRGIVTRNSRALTLPMLARLGLELDPVLCREDCPVKPDPAALWQTCKAWEIQPQECVVIGDHRIDVEAARRAGMHAVLFTGGGRRGGLADQDMADLVLANFAEPASFWDWTAQIDLEGGMASC